MGPIAVATNNTGARLVGLVGCSILNENIRLKKRDSPEDLPGTQQYAGCQSGVGHKPPNVHTLAGRSHPAIARSEEYSFAS